MKRKIFFHVIIVMLLMIVHDIKADINSHMINVSKDEVDNSVYIIGNYMFTRDSSNIYNGQLTTKRIMLAARTIDGNTEDDMIIYYKNSRGNWIDALTGNSINPPNEFQIINTNLVDVLSTPTLLLTSASVDSTDDEHPVIWTFTMKILQQVENGPRYTINYPDGNNIYYNYYFDGLYSIEVYASNINDNSYTLIKTLSLDDYNNEYEIIESLPAMVVNKYKIRIKKTYYGDTYYSDYSNDVTINGNNFFE